MLSARTSLLLLVCILCMGAHSAHARTIDCSLKQSQSFEIGDGKATAFKGATADQLSLSFTELDPKAGTALMVGNAGAERLSLIASKRKLTFIEITATGNVAVTSIDVPEGGAMYGVHHRQMWMSSGIISTWAGPCRRR
jgi:hypothetical protein